MLWFARHQFDLVLAIHHLDCLAPVPVNYHSWTMAPAPNHRPPGMRKSIATAIYASGKWRSNSLDHCPRKFRMTRLTALITSNTIGANRYVQYGELGVEGLLAFIFSKPIPTIHFCFPNFTNHSSNLKTLPDPSLPKSPQGHVLIDRAVEWAVTTLPAVWWPALA